MADKEVRKGPGRPPLDPSQRKAAMDSAHRRVDGWNNVISGLGGNGDKRKQTSSSLDSIILDPELESIYISDGLGARIVNLLPDDMTREGWELESDGYDDDDKASPANQVQAVLDHVMADKKLNEGLCWKRLYGGALIFIGAMDGQPLDTPLIPQKIRDIDQLRIIDRSDIQLINSQFQTDPTLPNYGKPINYSVWMQAGVNPRENYIIHASRCIELKGVLVPVGATSSLDAQQRYWGLSILQNVYQTLADLGGAFGSVGNLMYEVSIGKYTLKDLLDILSQPDGAALLQTRIEAMDVTKSVLHSIFMAEGETFERDTVALAGVSDILTQFQMILSASTGYPMTRLFGISPGGMNATGESDMNNYYDMVASRQKTELKPPLQKLVEIICQWKGLKEIPQIEFRPLQQMSEKEKAEIGKLEAEAENTRAAMYGAYITNMVITGEEVREMEWKDQLELIGASLELPPVEPPIPIVIQPPASGINPANPAGLNPPAKPAIGGKK